MGKKFVNTPITQTKPGAPLKKTTSTKPRAPQQGVQIIGGGMPTGRIEKGVQIKSRSDNEEGGR